MLAQMCAVCTDPCREGNVVIDDEQGSICLAQCSQCTGLLESRARVCYRITVLKRLRTTSQYRTNLPDQQPGIGMIRRDCVKPANFH